MSEEVQSFPGAFCEPCNKWRAPDTLMPDGSCPKCGTTLDEVGGVLAVDEAEEALADAKVPWHFWVMVGATVLYLAWRVVQGVGLLF